MIYFHFVKVIFLTLYNRLVAEGIGGFAKESLLEATACAALFEIYYIL